MKNGIHRYHIICNHKTKIIIENYYYLQSDISIKEGEEVRDVFLSDDFNSFVESYNEYSKYSSNHPIDPFKEYSEYSLKTYKLLKLVNGNGA